MKAVCSISNEKHFYHKMTAAIVREGKKGRRVVICEWCYEPKNPLRSGEVKSK